MRNQWASSEPTADKEALLREADGHPLFIAELIRAARSGRLTKGAALDLQSVLWGRIQERDDVERAFLSMLAVAGAPTPFDVVANAARVDVGERQTRLNALGAAQLIRITRVGEERIVEAYHDRVRESILLHWKQRDDAAESIPQAHLSLARTLVEMTPTEALSERVFAMIQQYHAARHLVKERSEAILVAQLNLRGSSTASRGSYLWTCRTCSCRPVWDGQVCRTHVPVALRDGSLCTARYILSPSMEIAFKLRDATIRESINTLQSRKS